MTGTRLLLRPLRIPEALRAFPGWLALASAIAAMSWVTMPWVDNEPPEPLVNVVVWTCFLAVSGLMTTIAVRRRQLLRDRPSLPLAILAVSSFFSLSLWRPQLLPESFSFGIYLIFGGAFHLVTFLLLALLLAPIAFQSSARYFSIIERIGLFSSFLLLTGAILNEVWMLFVYQRLYYSQDTVVDCFPFIPFGQWVLDQEWGGEKGALLAGAELWHLQALWLVFAAIAWGSAWSVYRRVARLLAA